MPNYPVIWSACARCSNPVALFEHDELAYLMSIHNGVVHEHCPTDATIERILTHATPHTDPERNRPLVGRPRQLVFTARSGSQRSRG